MYSFLFLLVIAGSRQDVVQEDTTVLPLRSRPRSATSTIRSHEIYIRCFEMGKRPLLSDTAMLPKTRPVTAPPPPPVSASSLSTVEPGATVPGRQKLILSIGDT